MKQYRELVQKVLIKGTPVEDRTGVGTLRLFGEILEFELSTFPIVTARKIDYKQAFGELAAFLKGATNKQQFQAFGCNYWNKVGTNEYLGPIYGAQWRDWEGRDQIADLLYLLENEPTSRRMILSTWNIPDIEFMCLPPCHLIAQFDLTEGYLNCCVYMRSVDVMLGLPYDLIVYALLTEILAGEMDCTAGNLTFMMGNTHIYMNHTDKAMELLERKPLKPSKLHLSLKATVDNFVPDMATLPDYKCHDEIKFELNL